MIQYSNLKIYGKRNHILNDFRIIEMNGYFPGEFEKR